MAKTYTDFVFDLLEGRDVNYSAPPDGAGCVAVEFKTLINGAWYIKLRGIMQSYYSPRTNTLYTTTAADNTFSLRQRVGIGRIHRPAIIPKYTELVKQNAVDNVFQENRFFIDSLGGSIG